MSDTQLWVEKYRPSKFADIKGQDIIVSRIKAMVSGKNLQHLLFAGPAGSGKTSLILVAAKELYGSTWQENILETNASMDRGINIVRERIKDFARTKALKGAPFKICILDEADALTRDAQQALRRIMEQYSSTVRFALLCNFSSKIIDPILSRCAVFRFRSLEKKDIESIINEISKNEKLKIDKSAIDAIHEVSKGDVRRAINILQSSASIHKSIDENSIYEVVSYAKPTDIINILNIAIKGDFLKARERLLEVILKQGLSGLDVIRQIQKEIWNLDLEDERKIYLTDKCGEIEFRMVEGSDEFLQLSALLSNFCK